MIELSLSPDTFNLIDKQLNAFFKNMLKTKGVSYHFLTP
jgi:hypothetical protein